MAANDLCHAGCPLMFAFRRKKPLVTIGAFGAGRLIPRVLAISATLVTNSA